MKTRILWGMVLLIAVVWLFGLALAQAVEPSIEPIPTDFHEFRGFIWINYGLTLLVVSIITSIVLIASVFAFTLSEKIEEVK
ncbi:MAG: hypothetical protein Q6363_005920 [Candidatus Njordarchaeota archaeon]